MKKTIALIFVSLFFLSSCINDTTDKKANLPTEKSVIENRKACLEIVNRKYDFGRISKKEHSYLDVEFELRNTGEIPLIISKVDVSCGCLSVNYSKEPINPGKIRKLVVHIDTKNQYGMFNKVIFINSNAENNLELIRITGEVEK